MRALADRLVVLDDVEHPWLLTLAIGTICGLAALWVVGRLIRARRARMGFRRLAEASGALEDLRARQRPPRRRGRRRPGRRPPSVAR